MSQGWLTFTEAASVLCVDPTTLSHVHAGPEFRAAVRRRRETDRVARYVYSDEDVRAVRNIMDRTRARVAVACRTLQARRNGEI